MKKFALICTPLLIALPMLSMSAACTSYPALNYLVDIKGAKGTMIKTQVCDKGQYSIKAKIKVEKFFKTVEVNQSAAGSYNASGITAQTFTVAKNGGDPVNAQLSAGALDPLSLSLDLSSVLSDKAPVFPFASSIFYNEKTVPVECATAKDPSAAFTGSTGQAIPATKVSCTTQDGSIAFNYLFSQDASPKMLTMQVTENGDTTLTATISD